EAPETTPPIVGKSNTRTMNSSATAGPSALMTARHERQKCPTSNAVTSSINVVVSLVWTVITANSTTADGRREHNHAETFGILRIAIDFVTTTAETGTIAMPTMSARELSCIAG